MISNLKKWSVLLLLVLHMPNAFSLGVEGRAGGGVFLNNQDSAQFDQSELLNTALGFEFEINQQFYLLEVEVNKTTNPDYTSVEKTDYSAVAYHEVSVANADISEMIRVNFLNIKPLSDHWSLYYGISVIGAKFHEYNAVLEYGELTSTHSDEYNAYYFGLNSQFDYRVFSLGALSVHAYASPFNYYFKLGASSDLGLKLKATF